LAPDCAIDAGGVPVHWLSDVKPAESVALLATFVRQQKPDGHSALRAIALHAAPEALDLLIELVKTARDAEVRKQAMSLLGQSHDTRALAFFEDVLKR
jgi:HEAT repeat protein